MLKKLSYLTTILIILVGCGAQSAEEQIHQRLTKAIQLEGEFQKQQEKITQLETEEQEIYNQIIAYDLDNEEKIKELSERAITSIHERSKEVEIEKESIEASKKEFFKIENLLNKVSEKEVREKAEEMYERMEYRYKAYDKLYDAYQKTLQLEEELYMMLLEDPDQKEVTAHIQSVNESYERVLDANEQFNLYTIEYNELKDEFYKTANIGQASSNG